MSKPVKTRSLEKRIVTRLVALNLLIAAIGAALCVTLSLSPLGAFTLLAALAVIGLVLSAGLYRSVTDACERFASQLDAIGNDEYNTWYFAAYNGGRLAALKGDVERLAATAAHKHHTYLQSESMLVDLIGALNLPLLLLDAQGVLYQANAAFGRIYGDALPEPGLRPMALGLVDEAQGWRLAETAPFNGRYQVFAHGVMRAGQRYTLLAFFSIEQALRDNEKTVWRQLLRVLNHEVRNSLTPIYSMSQSLQQLKRQGGLAGRDDDLGSDMLMVIEKRARHLLAFVENASSLSSLPSPRITQISNADVNQRLKVLYPDLVIAPGPELHFYADMGQLEQALINLIKNAGEASDGDKVTLSWRKTDDNVRLEILDSGTGIANPDNLFVPFYTTKPQGSGIGLVISRELVRNQGGELRLENRRDGSGCVASLTLCAT